MISTESTKYYLLKGIYNSLYLFIEVCPIFAIQRWKLKQFFQVDVGFGLLISFFYCFFCSGLCATTGIQAFTSELKNKLSSKCQRKAETNFTMVMKEICEEYDDKGIEKEDIMPDIDDGKSRSSIDESLKDSTNK